MKRVLLAIAALSLLAAPMASAAPAQGKGHSKGLVGKQMPPGQAKKWRKGERIPLTYIAPRYYIEPQIYHLAPPPPGYRWVGIDGDAYLVLTTNGLVTDVAIGITLR
jgi:Ni/Co efflux regulator RcnB